MEEGIEKTVNSDINSSFNFRKAVTNFEGVLKDVAGAFIGDSSHCPLKHTFADGIYVREIFIPKGTVVVGKIHKHAHPNFLLKGEVEVVTEYGGSEHLIAPLSMISKPGTKRIVRALQDTVWVTVHHNPTDTQNLDIIEKFVIADSYDEYEEFMIVSSIEKKESINSLKEKNI